MFLRSNIQEMMLRRRSRSMSSSSSCKLPSDATMSSRNNRSSNSDKKLPSSAASLFFTSPKLLHSSSLPNPTNSHPEMGYSTSPRSILQSNRAFSSDATVKRRRWRDDIGLRGLAGALDNREQGCEKAGVLASQLKVKVPLIRSSLEFGVKNKSSWVQLDGISAAVSPPGEMELSSEDYTCVISHGPNPRTRHIFGDRIVESCDDGFIAVGNKESSQLTDNLPGCNPCGFLSL